MKNSYRYLPGLFFLFIMLLISGCGQPPFEKAETLYRQREFTRAIEIFKKTVEQENLKEKSLNYLAACFFYTGDYSTSIEYSEKLLNLPEKSPELKKVIGDIERLADKATLALGMKVGKNGDIQRAYELLSSLRSNDYPPGLYIGILHRERGEFDEALGFLNAALNVSGFRENNDFTCEMRWEVAKVYKSMFERSQELKDYFLYIKELRRASQLSHSNPVTRKQIQSEYEALIRNPLYEKHYAHLQDAHNRIGRSFETGNTREIVQNANILIESSPLTVDRIYAYVSLTKMYLHLHRNMEKAVDSYQRAKFLLGGERDAIPLRLINELGEELYSEYKEERSPTTEVSN